MATIGLKIAQDPDTAGSLSLADTLAKATFGDPEGQMKARALASEVGVRMASRDKLIADTGLVSAKTKTEQDAEAARLNAGPLVGAAGASAVPAIVDPNDAHEVAVHNALVARERALGPVLVLGDNPNATAEGINKNYGGTILSAAASNPAIVSGDALRIAGGLSTGTAPSTSTVWSADDTSGVDAAAREHILEKQAESTLPEKPHDVTYRGQPGQTYRDPTTGKLTYTGAAGTETTPEKPDLVDLPGGGKGTLIRDANGNPTGVQTLPGAEGRPEKQDIIDLPSGGKGVAIRDAQGNVLGTIPIPGAGPAPKLVTVGKDTAVQNPDGTYTTPTVQGRPAEAPPAVFGGNSTADEALNFTTGLGVKMQDPGFKPTYQDAATYASAYNHLYEQPKPVEFKRPDGSSGINWTTSPPPAGSLTPAQVFARLTGQAAPPVQTPPVQTPPVQTPPVVVAAPPVATSPVVAAPPAAPAAPVSGGPAGSVVTQELNGPGPPPVPNEVQSRDRKFAGSAAFANKPLDKFTPDQIPGVLASMLAIPKVSGNSFIVNLARANLPEKDKEWARNALEFTAAVNYEQSGAAVNADEWENAKQIYIPMPGDKPKQLAEKAAARRDWMQNAAKSGWSNDPKGFQGFMASLDGGGSGPATDDVPPKSYTDQGGTPAGWKKVKNKGLWQ